MKLTTLALAVLCVSIAPRSLADDIVVQPAASDAFIVTNAAGTTERLRVDEATGDVSRNGSLFLHTRGAASTFVGPNAGPLNTGFANTGVGTSTLANNAAGNSNTAVGATALNANTSGSNNTAFGSGAMIANTTGSNNTAFGASSLSKSNATDLSAFGAFALFENTTGTGNTAFGAFSLFDNTTGDDNTAVGQGSLQSNTTGDDNVAVGADALNANVDGVENVAVGALALSSNTSGQQNVAIGRLALQSNDIGARNTAVGESALTALVGDWELNAALGTRALESLAAGEGNTAVGYNALSNLTAGSHNVAIGNSVGTGTATGSNNVFIGGSSTQNQSDTIRIGNSGHVETYIRGIVGNAVPNGVTVIISQQGELGTMISSARYKQDIEPLSSGIPALQRLRPVSFRYRQDLVGDTGESGVEYGLIAEEVAEVMPELVVRDEEGRPTAVRYQLLPSLLVGELQSQHRQIEARARTIQELHDRLEALETRLGDSEATGSSLAGRDVASRGAEGAAGR